MDRRPWRLAARGLALMLLPGCLHAGPRVVRYGEPEPVPIVHTSVDRTRWYVTVDAGRFGERLFFFDTGYSTTTCDDDLVEELGLTARGKAKVRGEAGTVGASKATLPTFRIGGHEVEGLRCLVRDLNTTSSIRDPGEVRVAGVLGADLLRAFRPVVDPSGPAVSLHEPRGLPPLDPNDPGVVRIPRELPFGTRFVMPVEVDGVVTWPVVDTGADGTHLDGGDLGLQPVEERRGVRVYASGTNGVVRRDLVVYRPSIRLAGEDVGAVDVYGRERTAFSDGLLGLDVLGHVRQDYDFVRGLARFTRVQPASVPSYSEWKARSRVARDTPPRDPTPGEEP